MIHRLQEGYTDCASHTSGAQHFQELNDISASPRDELNANFCTYLKPTDLESLRWDLCISAKIYNLMLHTMKSEGP